MSIIVAPARERGLKWGRRRKTYQDTGRSREGAWIEILTAAGVIEDSRVAPARERGLKC